MDCQPQARQLLHRAPRVPCLGAFAACAVRLTAVSCCLGSRSSTPTQRRLAGLSSMALAVCCTTCGLGREQSTTNPPPPVCARAGIQFVREPGYGVLDTPP